MSLIQITGILAILASKMGAGTIKAIDIEEWAFLNTKENAERNKTINISVEKGDANLLAGNSFQLILANINKNVLMGEPPVRVSPTGMRVMDPLINTPLARSRSVAGVGPGSP